jgi:hypothetical protein
MKYRMLVDSALEPQAVAGATVYECTQYDYGLASDDTRATGHQHISVTLNADGKGPSFTVRLSHLEEIHELETKREEIKA